MAELLRANKNAQEESGKIRVERIALEDAEGARLKTR